MHNTTAVDNSCASIGWEPGCFTYLFVDHEICKMQFISGFEPSLTDECYFDVFIVD